VSALPEYKTEFPRFEAQSLHKLINLDPIGLDLLSQMLQYQPAKRISAKKALDHPYFNDLVKEAYL